VLIEQQIMSESNYPFGAAMSIGLVAVVMVFLWALLRLTNVSTGDLSGTDEVVGDDSAAGAASSQTLFGRVTAALEHAASAAGIRRVASAVGGGVSGAVSTIDSNTREAMTRAVYRAYVAAVMLFVAAPLAIIVAVSFTPAEFLTFPPGGFSLRWYVEFFTDSSWTGALVNSLSIAGLSALLATTIGGVLAFALDRFDYRFERTLGAFGVLPILIPPVIIAVAFLVFFLQFGLAGNSLAIIVAHGIFYAPFPFILITQGLGEIDRTYEEAAMNLGASSVRTIRTITYPLLRTNVISGALFAFILSLNEYIIAWLLSLFLVDTIPIQIFNQLRYSYPPTIAAASTVFIALTVVVMTAIDRLSGGIWE